MGLKVLAEQELATTAIEALITEFGVIRDDALADSESFDIFANSCDDTDCLVT